MSDTELLPKSKPDAVRRLEVFTGAGRRRTWSAEQKARIVAESYESGETVSVVGRRHALTAQQLFGWRSAAGDRGSEREWLGLYAGDRGSGSAVRGGAGGIFQTDVTGDGTGDGSFGSNGSLGDILPTTNVGDFGRTFGPRGLNGRITTFNSTQVGQLTPAGQGIVANTAMTQADLTALGGVINGGVPLRPSPAGAINQAWLKTFDAELSWSYKFRERLELRPGVAVFNVFNFSNFEGPSSPFISILNGDPGSPNGTTASMEHGVNGNFLRTGLGSGVNAMGAPRAMQFQLKVIF